MDNETTKNFIENIIDEDNEKNTYGKRVHTRFPPEPNGYLHLGHAKSICLNFGIAKKYGGLTNLRFDDTNPSKENTEYVESIKRDVKWLGFDWDDRMFYAVQMMYVMFAIATIICISIVDTISRSQAVMVGALLGVALGSMVEHRYVGHMPSGFTRKGACACIISVVIMASIFAIGYLMPIIVSSISAAMVMVMAVAFVPYILKRCSDHVE